MPRRPRHPDPTNPDHYVHFLQRGYMRWEPNLMPALLAWLAMQEQILVDRRAETAGLSNRLPSAVRDGIIRQLDVAIEGVRTVSAMVPDRWRRIEWLQALARVQRPELPPEDTAGAGQPRAG